MYEDRMKDIIAPIMSTIDMELEFYSLDQEEMFIKKCNEESIKITFDMWNNHIQHINIWKTENDFTLDLPKFRDRGIVMWAVVGVPARVIKVHYDMKESSTDWIKDVTITHDTTPSITDVLYMVEKVCKVNAL